MCKGQSTKNNNATKCIRPVDQEHVLLSCAEKALH